MSLDKPTKNKMMQAPPSKKGFHFASDGVHEAMFVEAASTEEAEAIYHNTKKLLVVGGTEATTEADEQSTGTPEKEEKNKLQ